MLSLVRIASVIVVSSGLAQAYQSNPIISSQTGARSDATGTISLSLTDAQTGYAIPGMVSYGPMQGDWSMPFSQHADSSGHLRLTLPAGKLYLFEACASGYKSMRTYFGIQVGRELRTGFMMDSTAPAPEMQPKVLDEQLRPGYAMTFGYVVDNSTSRPLANVRVRWQQHKADAMTNASGYYALFVAMPGSDRNTEVADTLIAELPGYQSQYLCTHALYEDQWSGPANFRMDRGAGTTGKTCAAIPATAPDQERQPLLPEPKPIPPELLQWLSVTPHPCP